MISSLVRDDKTGLMNALMILTGKGGGSERLGANQISYCSEDTHALPARPSVTVGCRQGKAFVSESGRVMASGVLGCAEG